MKRSGMPGCGFEQTWQPRITFHFIRPTCSIVDPNICVAGVILTLFRTDKFAWKSRDESPHDPRLMYTAVRFFLTKLCHL